MKIGFIGLGLMGNPMAKNILKSGFELGVYNRNPARTKEIADLGAKIYNSPKELAAASDVVVSIITGPKDVEEVMLGENGVYSGAKKGLIVIDMSTIGTTAAKNIGEKLEKLGISFLDAPVTGSVPKAITGELTIFIGGEKAVFEKVKDVFLAMGKNLQYMGPQGTGQSIKLVNNLLVALTVTALSEGMLLADSLGLPRKETARALEEVPALSPFMKMKLPNFIKDEYPVAFSMANMRKDLGLAHQESKNSSGKDLPLLTLVEKLFAQGLEKGLSENDISAVIKPLEESL